MVFRAFLFAFRSEEMRLFVWIAMKIIVLIGILIDDELILIARACGDDINKNCFN